MAFTMYWRGGHVIINKRGFLSDLVQGRFPLKVVRDPCQKITLLLLKSKSLRVIDPESCF